MPLTQCGDKTTSMTDRARVSTRFNISDPETRRAIDYILSQFNQYLKKTDSAASDDLSGIPDATTPVNGVIYRKVRDVDQFNRITITSLNEGWNEVDLTDRTLTRISGTQFSVSGDWTSVFTVGRKLRFNRSTTYSVVTGASLSSGVTTVTVASSVVPTTLHSLDYDFKPIGDAQFRFNELKVAATAPGLANDGNEAVIVSNIGDSHMDATVPWARVRENLMPNPVFQYWSSVNVPNNWDPILGAKFAKGTTTPRTGSFDLDLNRTTTDPTDLLLGLSQTYSPQSDIGGQTATASIYFKKLSGTMRARAVLEALSQTGSVLSTTLGSWISATSWTQSTTGAITLPTNTFAARIKTDVETGGRAQFLADDASLIVNSVERIVDGSFETWADSLVPSAYRIVPGATISQSTDSGTFSFSVQFSGGGVSGDSFFYVLDLGQDISGVAFSAASSLKRVSGTGSVKVRLAFLDSTGATLSTSASSAITASSFTTALIENVTAPTNAQMIRVQWTVSDASSVFRADWVTLTRGARALTEVFEAGLPAGTIVARPSTETSTIPGFESADGTISSASEFTTKTNSSTIAPSGTKFIEFTGGTTPSGSLI